MFSFHDPAEACCSPPSKSFCFHYTQQSPSRYTPLRTHLFPRANLSHASTPSQHCAQGRANRARINRADRIFRESLRNLSSSFQLGSPAAAAESAKNPVLMSRISMHTNPPKPSAAKGWDDHLSLNRSRKPMFSPLIATSAATTTKASTAKDCMSRSKENDEAGGNPFGIRLRRIILRRTGPHTVSKHGKLTLASPRKDQRIERRANRTSMGIYGEQDGGDTTNMVRTNCKRTVSIAVETCESPEGEDDQKMSTRFPWQTEQEKAAVAC